MKLVIEISDRMYTTICGRDECECNPLESYIKNGTPLPKGHGSIYDKNYVKKSLIYNYLIMKEKHSIFFKWFYQKIWNELYGLMWDDSQADKESDAE